ncbi:MAG: putative sensor protein [Frankiales bacterium]|nr:putative sensor protein [Frankiales bacterium]
MSTREAGEGNASLGPRPSLASLRDAARVAAVERVVAQGPAGDRLQRLTTLAARVLRAPVAQVSLLGESAQIVATLHGAELTEQARHSPLEHSLCSITAASGQPLVVADAATHPWVRDLPPVTTGAVGAYLGVVLTDAAGQVLGSLCVYDPQPRAWSPEQVADLTAIGDAVSAELEQHASASQSSSTKVRLDLAAVAADLGSYDYDLTTHALSWDDRMHSLHGRTPQTFTGSIEAFQALVHPEDLPGVMQAFAHAVETAGELYLEYRVVLEDGSHRWVRARGRVLPDMLGRPARVLGAAYDSSPERGLRDELTRLMETMPAAFVRCDRDWVLTYVNTVAEGLYGRTRQELLGQDLWAAFPEARDTAFETQFRKALETGEPGMVEARFEPLDAQFEVHIWPDEQGLSFFFHDVSDRIRAHAALEAVSERLAVLASAGTRLGASLQPREVLAVLADLVVPELATYLVLTVVDGVAELLGMPAGLDPAQVHPVQLKHADPDKEDVLRQVLDPLTLHTTSDTGIGRAIRTGAVASRTRIPDELLQGRASNDEHLHQMRLLNAGPSLTVPLRAPSGVLGALTVGGTDECPLDQLLLVDLAARAAAALDNALAYARQQRAAKVLQTALLPREAPSFPGIEVATRYLPATAEALAGGDFFKTVRVDGRLVSMLGDVMGHGTASAARAGQLHGLVAVLALEGHSPGELLERLAGGVNQMMDLELATLVVCSYDPDTRQFVSATAGHPPPLFAPVAGEPYYLDLEPGAPIGVAPSTYPESACVLEPGATMVLFSDGLIERRGESISDGLERLRRAVEGLRLPPDAVADHILQELGVTTGADDDIALLVLRHL